MDRLTVPESAARLGLSENALRRRVRRGTIECDKDEDGRVYVYLSPEMPPTSGGKMKDTWVLERWAGIEKISGVEKTNRRRRQDGKCFGN